MSQAGKASNAGGGGGGGGGIETINGDVGSVTGSTITFFANNSANNSGSSVEFVAINSTTLQMNVTDNNTNTLIGLDCGNITNVATRMTGMGFQTMASIQSASDCVGVGINSLQNLVDGTFCVAIGNQSLQLCVSDSNHVAIGNDTLTNINGASDCVAIGSFALNTSTADSFNVAIGSSALNLLDGGNQNCAIGYNSQFAAQTLSDNTSCGNQSLFNNQSGGQNCAFGSGAMQNAQSSQSVAIGYNSLQSTTASNLVAVGYLTLLNASTDIQHTAIGWGCMTNEDGGIACTGVGFQSFNGSISATNSTGVGVNTLLNSNGDSNTALGMNAGSNYTTSESSNILLNNPGVLGESNALHVGSGTGTGTQQISTAFISGINGNTIGSPLLVTIDPTTDQLGTIAVPATGIFTLDGDIGTASGSTVSVLASGGVNNCGSSVRIVGDNASTLLLNVSDTNNNTLIGLFTGPTLTPTGNGNTALGVGALASLTSGNSNVAIGNSTLQKITNTDGDMAIGDGSLASSTSGGNNVSIGVNTLGNLVGGAFNIGIGQNSGILYMANETSNICLNSGGVSGDNRVLRIGNATGGGVGELLQSYICGINGNTITSPNIVTIDPSTNQLGVTPATKIITSWIDESGSFSADSGKGYFCTAALTATLPASPSQGDTINFAVDTASAVVIQANTGQTIRIGNTPSSSGGSQTSTLIGCSLQLVFRSANTEWFSIATEGSFTPA